MRDQAKKFKSLSWASSTETLTKWLIPTVPLPHRDPRQRRLAQQQQEKLLNNKTSQVPEKLSFKEKMKMFAMETGEDGTPRDKVKISRAQRDIDNLGTPTSGNSSNENTNTSNVSVDNLNSKFKSAAITSN